MDQAIGFPKGIQEAYEEILKESSPTNWAIFGYDRGTNDLKVLGSGDGGLEELAEEWEDSKIQYAFCRVIEPISKLPKFVLICWCGDGVPVAKKGLFHHHVNDVVRFFKAFHVQINARAEIDVTPDAIMKKVKDSSGAKYSIHNEKGRSAADDVIAPVGSNYEPVRTNPKSMSTAPPSYRAPAAVPAPAAPSPVSSFTAAPPAVDRVAAERERREREERESRARAEQEAREREARESQREREREREAREAREREEAERRDRERREAEAAAAPPPPPPAPAVPTTSASQGLRAMVLYTYEPQEENEVEMEENEIMTEIEMLDEGWWSGKNSKGKVGLFPSNYVQLIEDIDPQVDDEPAPPPPPARDVPQDAGREASALYDYQAEEENEVSFSAGDRITNIQFVSDDWWQGEVNGVVGLCKFSVFFFIFVFFEELIMMFF
ncbi:hypothetical protein HDU76_012338 [Blyttiomyces sp. JEL0837]|nr:hypothetical protein HDU76_012338 [Blyttiomyces sp. JEL0837]